MNIPKINFDLKKLDAAEVRKILSTRQDLVVNILSVLAAFFFMFQIVSGKQEEARVMKSRISELEKKIELINQHTQTSREFNEYLAQLPQGVPGQSIVDKLTDYADKRGVQIVYVSPTQTESKKLFDRTSVSVNLSAKTYQDLLYFVYDVETSPFNLRIDRWSASMESNKRSVLAGRSSNQKIVETINAQIEIGSINFKK